MSKEDAVTWILVAARNGAALFEHDPGQGLRRLDRIPGPPDTGDLADPAASEGAQEYEVLRFTLELAEVLEQGVRGGVGALILMAEARMLGAIRRHLSAFTAQHIHASLNVAQPDWDEDSLQARLAPLLTLPRPTEPPAADLF